MADVEAEAAATAAAIRIATATAAAFAAGGGSPQPIPAKRGGGVNYMLAYTLVDPRSVMTTFQRRHCHIISRRNADMSRPLVPSRVTLSKHVTLRPHSSSTDSWKLLLVLPLKLAKRSS